MKNLFSLMALMLLLTAGDCTYQLDVAKVIYKGDGGIVVSYLGDNEKRVDCEENNLWSQIQAGDFVYLVVARNSPTIARLASQKDLLDIPCKGDAVTGPFWKMSGDELVRTEVNMSSDTAWNFYREQQSDGGTAQAQQPQQTENPSNTDWVNDLWKDK